MNLLLEKLKLMKESLRLIEEWNLLLTEKILERAWCKEKTFIVLS